MQIKRKKQKQLIGISVFYNNQDRQHCRQALKDTYKKRIVLWNSLRVNLNVDSLKVGSRLKSGKSLLKNTMQNEHCP